MNIDKIEKCYYERLKMIKNKESMRYTDFIIDYKELHRDYFFIPVVINVIYSLLKIIVE